VAKQEDNRQLAGLLSFSTSGTDLAIISEWPVLLNALLPSRKIS
jgi:hypothetical protein